MVLVIEVSLAFMAFLALFGTHFATSLLCLEIILLLFYRLMRQMTAKKEYKTV